MNNGSMGVLTLRREASVDSSGFFTFATLVRLSAQSLYSSKLNNNSNNFSVAFSAVVFG